MAVLFTDDYNRANGAIGANYTELKAQTFSIVSNAVPCTFGSDAAAFVSAVSWPADQYAQIAISAIAGASSDSGAGLMLRCDGTDQNYYRIVINTTQISIGRFLAGSFSEFTTRSATWTSGDVLKAQIVGTTMKIFRNGAQLGADITNSDLAAGSAGIAFSSGADGTIDDFEGGDFGAPWGVAWIKG